MGAGHWGVVKVLDFGLAKSLEPVTATGADVTMSPTISTPALTRMGIILGTAAYMSPEQAKGRPADKRRDVLAFGCVLYEMLTGKRTFEGEDVSDTLAFVLTKEPDWCALPKARPPLPSDDSCAKASRSAPHCIRILLRRSKMTGP